MVGRCPRSRWPLGLLTGPHLSEARPQRQAGLVLKNVGLTAALQARLEELRASRQRLVAAQDEERRRLERNLHDGAQQQLVALGVQLGLAQKMASVDAPQVAGLLDRLRAQVTDALDDLRDLARGI